MFHSNLMHSFSPVLKKDLVLFFDGATLHSGCSYKDRAALVQVLAQCVLKIKIPGIHQTVAALTKNDFTKLLSLTDMRNAISFLPSHKIITMLYFKNNILNK